MVLDPELLGRAKTAGADVEQAERQALLSRAEYHTAIRRLHLAGATLREIAEALGLSHQRVQQIVQSAGGTWWGRLWRNRRVGRDATCTWCGRPPSEVSKLIAGPNVYICDACVESAERAAAGRAAAGPFAGLEKGRLARCAFCAKRHGQDRRIVTASAANICSNCLRACRDILDASAVSQ